MHSVTIVPGESHPVFTAKQTAAYLNDNAHQIGSTALNGKALAEFPFGLANCLSIL